MRTYLLLCMLFLGISCSKSDDQPAANINPWDGRYRIEGSLTDFDEPAITWPGSYEYNMETVSSTQIRVISKDLGFAGHLISHGGSLSYYSKFGLLVTIDPSTNKITGITNTYGQPSENGRSAVLDPSGENKWDPVTKNIHIKYWMDQTGITGHKAAFDETWVYIGAR